MRVSNVKVSVVILLGAVMCLGGVLQSYAQQPMIRTVEDGIKVKVKGIISSRGSDSLLMKDLSGTDVYFVELIPGTQVKTYRKGVFRGAKEYAVSYLLRGLRIEVSGVGNSKGHLVANVINFDEADLKTAQALQVTVDPVEAQAAANAARIAAEEENAKRMSGQIDEANAAAARAQATADEANNRINGLDDFEPVKTVVVPFAVGSSTIGPKGRAIIDEAAKWAKTQNTKGWVVAVVGFADSTGNSAKNKTLSEKRANAVIGYMVSKHGLPITRLVQPFGAGADQPVASNSTAAGRAQNRRVEIRLLVNKGIAGK